MKPTELTHEDREIFRAMTRHNDVRADVAIEVFLMDRRNGLDTIEYLASVMREGYSIASCVTDHVVRCENASAGPVGTR